MADTDPHPYRFERLTPDLLPMVRTLQAAVYGAGITEEDHRRKFTSPVPGHEVIGYLAYAPDGMVAAYYGVFPMLLEHQGQPIVVSQSGDTMTHPDHQGRGLFAQLATRTNTTAKAEGIAFVFGFPNSNSYPGLAKYQSWIHRRVMRSYSLFVPTLPLPLLLGRRSTWQRRLADLHHKLLAGLRLARPATHLTSSVLADGRAGAVRDQAYFDHKRPVIMTFEQSGVRVYFRLDEHVSVGDLVARPGARPWGAIARLVVIAALCGRVRIRYHVSPGSASDRLLRGRVPVKEGLPYGHVAFDPAIDPEDFDFTFIDYDTF